MEYILVLVLGIIIGSYLKTFISDFREKRASAKNQSEETDENSDIDNFYKLAEEMEDFFEKTAHPKDLLDSSDFQRGIEMLRKMNLSNEALSEYATGDNSLICCMALAHLYDRSPDKPSIEKIISSVGNASFWAIYFIQRILDKHYRQPVIAKILVQTREWWPKSKYAIQFITYPLGKCNWK